MSAAQKPTMLPVDMRDDRTATALHEAGHALAYIATGLGFEAIDMGPDNGAVGFLVPHRQMVDAFTRAQTAMAGPAVEAFMLRASITPDPATARLIVERIDEARDYAAEDPNDAEHGTNDEMLAGPYSHAVLPWVLTLLTSNWSSVEAMTRRILDGGERFTSYDALRSLVREHPSLDTQIFAAWSAAIEAAHHIA